MKLPSDPEFQQRLDELGSFANEGVLSDEERRDYDAYIEAMDVIALLRVKVLYAQEGPFPVGERGPELESSKN